ncbi:MAG: hypothetical protein CMJ85_12665 [Planctomycetes bacterium]|jgi:hypothetical protein|nr:hypothetical protein [Planctomycetota bacterium]
MAVPAALTLIAVVVLHVQVLFGPLLFDDLHAVAQNPAIRELMNIPAFFIDPDHFSVSNGRMYRPLVLTTLAFDHSLGGGAAWAFKLGNLVMHVASCALLLAALPKLFARAGLDAVACRRGAVAATLLFGLHPLQVESLCLVSSRSEVLAALGLLVALRGWLCAAGSRPRQAVWLALGTAMACLSKETGILVPPAVLLVEYLLPANGERPGFRGIVPRALPVLAGLPVVVVYLYLRKALFGVATASFRAMNTGGDPFSGGTRDFATQLESMAWFLPKAVSLWLWPQGVGLDHTEFLGLGWSSPFVLAGAAFVVGSIFAALVYHRRYPIAALAVLGATLFALPWILVPLNVPLAEHRLYVPMLFATLPVGAVVGWRFRRTVLQAAFGCVLALLIVRSAFYQKSWRSAHGIWQQTVCANPKSFRGWCGLADAHLERDQPWRALACLEKANRLYARYAAGVQSLCEVRVRLMEHCKTRRFAEDTVRIAETWAEERWKDPFPRLTAGRARMHYYRFTKDPRDLRWAESWALSPLAMVEPKMLVFRTAAETMRRGGDFDAALSLFDASEQRGLSNDDLLMHKAEILVAAGRLTEAAPIVATQRQKRPFDAAVLGLALRFHTAHDDVRGWNEVVAALRRLGYDVQDLPKPPSLRTESLPPPAKD